MRHLVAPLLVVPLLVLAPSPALAVGMCQGQPATLESSTPGATLTGTEGPDVILATASATIQALGGDDLICTSSGGSIDAGAGDDRVEITSFDVGGSVDAGPDRDLLEILPTTRVVVDLGHGEVVMGGQTLDIAGFEDVTATAYRVTVRGDAKSNDLLLTGCIVKGYGASGNDLLSLGSPRGFRCKAYNLQLYGQGGNDRLTGNRLANLLVGGGGRDAANGKAGQDRCAAESEVKCERAPRESSGR
jgi:Ca2+-binding RTX toxin-like protein